MATNNTSHQLLDNQYVKELLAVLDSNGKDSSGLTALMHHVNEMEAFVKHAENRISDMKAQLDDIKEIQNHPLKAALKNAIKSLEQTVAKIKKQIDSIKAGIIKGCKDAVAAFRENGISALDKLATFFNVKGELESLRQSIDKGIKTDERAVEKIEAFSKEYHSAGRAFKNMARVIIGRQPIDRKKEAGKLARAVSAPYRANITIMKAMRLHINKVLTRLDKLQAYSWAKRETGAAAKKPSIMDRLQTNLAKVEEAKREHRQQERVAAKGAEI